MTFITNIAEFQQGREAAVKSLATLVHQADTILNSIEELSNKFGIAVDLNLAGRRHTHQPNRPDGMSEDDVVELHGQGVLTDWQESEDYYGEYTGWTNSSTYC